MTELVTRFVRDERGATSIEYSLIAVVVSIIFIAALAVIGPAVSDMLDSAAAPF
ncbi:Flp family type IVb pilin [Maricaulis sp.]|uniref:Flp family type IVb pilin n=1 Tax=Maricaulis sp. TaxID=1486257 RepID=UPI002B2781AC|nr:Flp family type IVb pilin [Maricaulis sp.]